MATEFLAGFTHVFVPGAADASVLLCLHGTGGDERDLLDLGRALRPDAALLAPRGRVVERDGDAPRFFRRIPTGDSSTDPFTSDDDEVTARADELGTFVTAARDRYDLGGRPVVAVGFSNGANIAGALLLVSPQPVRAAALLAAMPMLSASPPSDLTGVAVFCGGGTHDPVATPRHVEALARALSERGAAVDVHWHPDGHSVHPTTITAATAWLAERVPATRT